METNLRKRVEMMFFIIGEGALKIKTSCCLLNTSFLLELRRGSASARHALLELAERTTDLGCLSFSVCELCGGAFYRYLKWDDTSGLAWLEDLLGWVTACSVDKSTAEVAARVKAEAVARGL